MKIITREDLLKEQREETIEFFTPASKVVRELFSNELSAHKWVKYSLKEIVSLIDTKIEELKLTPNEKHILLLKKAVAKCKTKEAILMKMETFLLGESQ